VTDNAETNGSTTAGQLLGRANSRTAMSYVVAGLVVLFAAVLAGDDIAHHIEAIEAWIASIGPWSFVAFVGLYVVATTLMLPESVLSIVAGALFGIIPGLAVVITGSLLAATLQYLLSRQLLHDSIQRLAATRPRLAAIQRAVMRDEFRLQVLLRLTPLNPATLSYVLGGAGVRFTGFLAASLASLPHLVLEVYFGYAGKHVVRMAGAHTGTAHFHDFVVIGGFVLTLIVMAVVSRMAQKALHEADY
jgi:uncharacterized membrane protein YdjX (TVP38/TMEM64 family)